jgi:hypothetical protein
MRQPTPERFGDDGGQCLSPFCGAPLEFADDVIWKNKRSLHMDNHTHPCFLLQVPLGSSKVDKWIDICMDID